MVACEWFHIDWMDLPQGKRSVGPYRCTSSFGLWLWLFFSFLLGGGGGSVCKTSLEIRGVCANQTTEAMWK